MNIQGKELDGQGYALVNSQNQLVLGVQSALDLVMMVQHETGCSHIAISKEALPEELSQLSTHLTGEILQKFITYYIQIVIIGDFSKHTSKVSGDFVYESNQGRSVLLVVSEEEATQKLCRVQVCVLLCSRISLINYYPLEIYRINEN